MATEISDTQIGFDPSHEDIVSELNKLKEDVELAKSYGIEENQKKILKGKATLLIEHANQEDRQTAANYLTEIEKLDITASETEDTGIEEGGEVDEGVDDKSPPATTEPEKAPTFIDKLGSGLESLSKKFESMQNFIAYHFAPILESLQKIKIPFLGDMQANIDGFMGFVGMNRTMLFGSIRKNKIDPLLRPETPHLDTQAIQSLVGMAENIRATCPGYTVKEFFDAATTGFALYLKNAHNERKVFVLDELATFVANSDIPKKQKEYADKLPKPVATPLTTAATVGMPGSPSAPSATPAPTTTPAVTSAPVTTPTPAVGNTTPPPPPPAVPAP